MIRGRQFYSSMNWTSYRHVAVKIFTTLGISADLLQNIIFFIFSFPVVFLKLQTSRIRARIVYKLISRSRIHFQLKFICLDSPLVLSSMLYMCPNSCVVKCTICLLPTSLRELNMEETIYPSTTCRFCRLLYITTGPLAYIGKYCHV